jgi:hypothetical protein
MASRREKVDLCSVMPCGPSSSRDLLERLGVAAGGRELEEVAS